MQNGKAGTRGRAGLLIAITASAGWGGGCVGDDGGPVDAAACLPMPAGALHWWTGDGTGADAIGGAHAMLLNGVTHVPGLVASGRGTAFSFDGVDAIGIVADTATLNPTGSFSVMAWARPREAPTHSGAIIGKGHPWAESWVLDTHNGVWRAFIRDRNVLDTRIHGPNLVTDVWTHLTMTWDGGQLALYVDAVLQDTRAVGSIHQTDGIVGIGARSEQGFQDAELDLEFTGDIDEIMFFGRSLGAAEIRRVFKAREAGICKS